MNIMIVRIVTIGLTIVLFLILIVVSIVIAMNRLPNVNNQTEKVLRKRYLVGLSVTQSTMVIIIIGLIKLINS